MILLIGVSRGLGLAMAEQFLKKGWNVVGTVWEGAARTKLHDLADRFEGKLEIETLDICEQAQLATLRKRLSGRVFEMPFVNAGLEYLDYLGRTVPW
jgi:NAD(P)-dependent dehydrogenase (short-subunit alcohol dehydrogenase family)